MTTSFIHVLHTDRPAPDRADKMGLYGWLIGSWEMDTVVHADDGTTQQGRGEIHFGWVLEGRAIQDVWILPGVFFGTTLRVYDPGLDAWHILWSDPLRQFYTRQIGRAHGADIVQEGTNDAGDATRWSFSEITGDSFRWRGERSHDGGATWHQQAEFFARRMQLDESLTAKKNPTIDHVSIGVHDIARTKRFYDAALEPLGYKCLSQAAGSLGYGQDTVAFWISAVARPVPPDDESGLHLCFSAPTRRSVDAFHAVALAAGGRDNGAPGVRADYGANYYAAFVVDPDGYRIEAYCGRAEP
jgi:catechol 2,3-dioxygenase-like lactoylglutathione lyase family enzyme